MAREMKTREGFSVQTKTERAAGKPHVDRQAAVPRSSRFAPAGPRAVANFVPGLTRKAFEKFGFAAANLVTDWATIVGPEIAAYSAPERLKWPRIADPHGKLTEVEPKRAGATLLLRVEGARA